MSNFRALQRLGGAPAGITPLTEEEKEKTRIKPVLKPRPVLPEKPSRTAEPRKPRTKNPLEAPSKAIKAVQNEVRWGAKAAGNALGNVIRGAAGKAPVTVEQAEKAQKIRNRQKPKTAGQADLKNLDRVGEATANVKRAIGGAPVRAAEGIVGTAVMGGDLVNLGVDRLRGRETDPSLNPFHLKYIEPELNTGIAVPESSAGRLAQGILSFVGTAASIGTRFPSATTKVGAFVRGEVGGVGADILLTRKGDGNLSTLIQDALPEEWRDSVLLFLAVDEDDSAVSSRLKAALEGVGLGAVFGALGALKKARNKKLGPEDLNGVEGAPTREQELEIRSNLYQQYLDEAAAAYGDAAIREANRFDEINLRLLDELEAKQLEIDFGSIPGSGQFEIDPGGPRQQQLTLEDVLPQQQSIDQSVDLGGQRPQEPTQAPSSVDYEPAAPQAVKSVESLGAKPEEVQAAIQSRVDLGYTPQDFSLLPQERAASFIPAPLDVAIKADYPTQSFTDAQVKSWRWDDKLETDFREFENNPKVQEILLESPTLKDREVVADSYKYINDILEATGETDLFKVPDIAKSFEAQGLLQTVKRGDKETTIFTEGASILVARTYFRDIGKHAWTLAQEMADLAEKGNPFGNLPDKMLDDLIAMMNIGKRTQQLGGRLTRSWGLSLDSQTGTYRLSAEKDGQSGFDEAIAKIKDIQDNIAAGRDDVVRDDLNILGAMLRASGGEPSKIMNFWKLARTIGFKDMGTAMIQSIFSGTRTQLTSIIGNTYTVLERPASAMITSALRRDPHASRMALAGLRATAQAIPEALEMSWKALRSGPEGYIHTKAGKYIQMEAQTVDSLAELSARAKTRSEQAAASFLTLQHRMINLPIFAYGPRLLSSGDEAFQHLALRQWAAMESMYKASSEATNTKEAYTKYLDEFYKKKVAPDGRIIDEDLQEWIAEATFQGETQEWVKSASEFLNQLPILKWFVPVIDTPAEIFRYVGKHTPGINVTFTKDYAEITQRALDGDKAAIAKKAVYDGRVGLGMTIAGSAGLLAMSGSLNGYGPAPGTDQWRIWQNLGRRPMTIRIGDKWYDYSSVEPMATIFGTVGDSFMLLNMGFADAAHSLMGQIGFTVASSVLDKTFLTGLRDLTEVMDLRATDDQRTSTLLGLVNNTLPLSSMRRALFNTFNPVRKEYQNQTERLWAQSSVGLIDRGAVFIDPLTGENNLSYGGGFYNANSPIRVAPENMDPLKWQLEKDGFDYRTNKQGPNQVELSVDDRQKVHQIMFEIGIRQVLEEAVTDPNYRQLADSWDRRPYDPDQPGTAPPHIAYLDRQWNLVRRRAIDILMDRDPEFLERMKEGAETRRMYQEAAFEDAGAPEPTLMNKLLQGPK
jgi:hypothetical protein